MSKKILLVDDDESHLFAVKRVLTKRWFIVDSALNLSEWLIKISADLFAIITDTSLVNKDNTNLDWIKLAEKFKTIKPDGVVVAMSVLNRSEWKEWLNCTKFLKKLSDSFTEDLIEVLK